MEPQQEKTARLFDSYKDSYSEAVGTAVSLTGLKPDFFLCLMARLKPCPTLRPKWPLSRFLSENPIMSSR